MVDDGRLKIGYGTLNDVEQQDFGRILDPRNTSAFDILRQVSIDSFRKTSLSNSGHFKGIVLRVDINPLSNPINSWEQKINPRSRPRLSVKVRIPELHACLLEPANYGSAAGASNHIIDMYPTFVAVTDDIANDVPVPGDIVWVDFGNRNNMTEPQYWGIAYSYAQGGAVGRETGKGMFAKSGKSPFGVTSPRGDNPITGLASEGNQIPGAAPFSSSREKRTTIGSFDAQKDHVLTPNGLPPIKNPSMAYENGSKIGLIELVEISSGKWIAKSHEKPYNDLVNAAKLDGVTIGLNSGFRSFEQQEELYRKYLNGTGNTAAKPGYSNHQTGIAFDFATGGPNSDAYRWLATNAHKFGFYNAGRFFSGQKEHWHWEYRGINDSRVLAEGKRPLSEKLRSFA